VKVELIRLELERVPGRAGDERSADLLAEMGDITLEHCLCARRRLLAPELVDEAVGRDNFVSVQEEHGEHGSLLWAAERQRPSFRPSLDRAEDPKLHHSSAGHGNTRPI